MRAVMIGSPLGDDNMIVDVARVSFDKKHYMFKAEQNAGLIRYLAREGHWSPFAHPHLQFRCSAPIWLARQLAKHQIGLSWNEVSRRYVDDEPEIDFAIGSIRRRSGSVKQGSTNDTSIADETIGVMGNYMLVHEHMSGHIEDAQILYEHLIERDVAPECARQALPLATETSWIWTGSLMAFARIVAQRSHTHAQLEAQQFAQLLNDEIVSSRAFPVAWHELVKWEGHRQNIYEIVSAATKLLNGLDESTPETDKLRSLLGIAPAPLTGP